MVCNKTHEAQEERKGRQAIQDLATRHAEGSAVLQDLFRPGLRPVGHRRRVHSPARPFAYAHQSLDTVGRWTRGERTSHQVVGQVTLDRFLGGPTTVHLRGGDGPVQLVNAITGFLKETQDD
ncbi:unnamed protein product [Lota lota]